MSVILAAVLVLAAAPASVVLEIDPRTSYHGDGPVEPDDGGGVADAVEPGGAGTPAAVRAAPSLAGGGFVEVCTEGCGALRTVPGVAAHGAAEHGRGTTA